MTGALLLEEGGHVEIVGVVGVEIVVGLENVGAFRQRVDVSRFALAGRTRVARSSHRSKPAAITVTLTSSPISSSITVPKMMLASGCATPWMISAASFTSNRPRSLGPEMLSRMPRAPSMAASSNGLEMAAVRR